MIDKLKSLGTSLLGIAFFVGLLLLGGVFVFGTTVVSALLYPIFEVLASLSILIFVLLILPLSLMHKIRPFLSQTTYVFSIICGVTIWMFSFITIIRDMSWIAFVLLFFFHFVAPIAAIGLFFKQEWYAGFSIIIGLIFTYGMRFYSIWLANLYDKNEEVKMYMKSLNQKAKETVSSEVGTIAKRQVKILYGDSGNILSEGGFFNELVDEKYESSFECVGYANEIYELAEEQSFDIFILILNNIIFTEHPAGIGSALSMVSELKAKYQKPIIAISGFNDVTVEKKSLEAGANFFFPIPFDYKQLKKAIEDCLNSKET